MTENLLILISSPTSQLGSDSDLWFRVLHSVAAVVILRAHPSALIPFLEFHAGIRGFLQKLSIALVLAEH